VIDVGSSIKAYKYHEINIFILWFYIVTTLAIKIFLNFTHVNSKMLALVYILLKTYGIMLASFTLLYRHLSHFSNMRTLLPEFTGMRKFITLNTFKFLMISLTIIIRILPT